MTDISKSSSSKKHFYKRLRFKLILVLIVFYALITQGINLIGLRTKVKEGINTQKIESVYIGMPYDSLVQVLGSPYSITGGPVSHTNSCQNSSRGLGHTITANTNLDSLIRAYQLANDSCCHEYARRKIVDKGYDLSYSLHVPFSDQYPMLKITLDSNLLVENVYATLQGGIITEDYSGYLYWNYYDHNSNKAIRSVNRELFEYAFNK